MNYCSYCGNQLIEFLHGDVSGMYCGDKMCVFNFRRERCPACGKGVAKAEQPELGRILVYCADGHEWVC